jgi:hypothetical protein
MRKVDSTVTLGLMLFAVACGDDGSNGLGGASEGGGASDGGGVSAGAGDAGGAPSGAGTPGNGGSAPDMCAGGPLALPIPGCMPVPAPGSDDPHQDCVDRINQFRYECQCLPPLARWTDAEGCSDSQSADDQADDAPHGHFGVCGEGAQNSCPNWPSAGDVVAGCLQSMWDEGPGEPFIEHGHYINMSNTGYTKVACGFATGPNGVWANQNFSQ